LCPSVSSVNTERQHGDDGVVREVFDGSHAEAEVARVSAQAKKDAEAKKKADEDQKRQTAEKNKDARARKAQIALEKLTKAQNADTSCNILEASNRTIVHSYIVDKSDKGYFNWYLGKLKSQSLTQDQLMSNPKKCWTGPFMTELYTMTSDRRIPAPHPPSIQVVD
jgi:hypothetical protein